MPHIGLEKSTALQKTILRCHLLLLGSTLYSCALPQTPCEPGSALSYAQVLGLCIDFFGSGTFLRLPAFSINASPFPLNFCFLWERMQLISLEWLNRRITHSSTELCQSKHNAADVKARRRRKLILCVKKILV